MCSQTLEFATYRLDDPSKLRELVTSSRFWWPVRSSIHSFVEACCVQLLKDPPDLVALQNVAQKSTLKRILSSHFSLANFARLSFAYNPKRLRFLESRNVDLLSLVVHRVDTDPGYAGILPTPRFIGSLASVHAMYGLFEFIGTCSSSSFRFIAVNCDFSGTPANAHTFRSALVREIFRYLYEDACLTRRWNTRRVVILGSFKSPPGSLPYDYLTRLTRVVEEEFVAKATRTEVGGVVRHTGQCNEALVQCWCFLTVPLTCVGQLHHLTRVVIETARCPVECIDGWELYALESGQSFVCAAEKDGDQLTLLFDPPSCSLTGMQRHFRLSWLERREKAAAPLLNLSSACLGNVIRVYGSSYGCGDAGEDCATELFRSAYATHPHSQSHFTLEELLVKNPILRNVVVPRDYHHSDLGMREEEEEEEATLATKDNAVLFTTWSGNSPWSPFSQQQQKQYGEPQFTTFFPIHSPPLWDDCFIRVEDVVDRVEFTFGTHDYILYHVPSFHCQKVRPLPSLDEMSLGGIPGKDPKETASHVLLSCTMEFRVD